MTRGILAFIVRNVLLALVMLTLACSSPEVPVNTVLWRLDGEWTAPPGSGARVNSVTLISFRSGDEYIEHHCQVIERPGNDAVYIVSSGPRLVSTGLWSKDGAEIRVKRLQVSRKPPAGGARDPLCENAELLFKTDGRLVTGQTADMKGTWAPITRLVSPDYESYINLARNSPIKCEQQEK